MQRTKPDIAEARRISEHHSSDLATYSGETFYALYRNAGLEDWVDESRIRKTFYGETPKTIEHVNRTQYYYLSRANLTLKERTRDFLPARRNCLSVLRDLFGEQRNDQDSWKADRSHNAETEATWSHSHFEDPFHFVT